MLKNRTFTKKDAEKLSFTDNHLIIPDGYTRVKYHFGFYNTNDVQSITIPASIRVIEPNAFSSLYDLKSIYVDKNNSSFKIVDGILFSMDGRKLIKCPPKMGLSSYVLPDGVTSIESGAFGNCEDLESITLPNSLRKIGSSAFLFCGALKRIDIPASVKKIENLAIASCSNLTAITIPECVNIDGKVFLHCYNLEEFTVTKSNSRSKHICTIDGVLFNRDCSVLIDYPIGNKRKSYTIPDGVREIMPGTFEDAYNLVEIKLPESIERIGHNAFNNCLNLENVNIPSGVTTIENLTFYCCRALKKIDIPHGVTRIGYQAFSSCDGLSEIIVPDTVTAIELGAFSCCFGLTDITIPDSVTDIGYRILSSMNPFTVHCKEGSIIHKYAVENDYEFSLITEGKKEV